MSGKKINENLWEFSMSLDGRLCVVGLEVGKYDCTEKQKEDLFNKLKWLSEERWNTYCGSA